MSSILDDAENALSRWRQMNPNAPLPPVAIFLRDHDKPMMFNGLAVAPHSGDGRAFSAAGYSLPIVVAREDDIERIVIGEYESRVGFKA